VETAKAGIYGDYALRNTSDLYKRKYFSTVDQKKLQVRPEVKKLITISRLNLQDDSKMPLLRAPQGRPDRRPGMGHSSAGTPRSRRCGPGAVHIRT